jgi:hypothetical protein
MLVTLAGGGFSLSLIATRSKKDLLIVRSRVTLLPKEAGNSKYFPTRNSSKPGKKMINIRYIFDLDSERQEIFELLIDGPTMELVHDSTEEVPAWTDLQFHQCPHCPLKSHIRPKCPVALSLSSVIRRFERVNSYDEITLKVITEERTVVEKTTAQRGISSLLGLLFATSGCPHTDFLKPMARFHLPLSSEEETIYRATGMYLLAQYFLEKTGSSRDTDFEGLRQIYHSLHLINRSIADRIRSATDTDSSTNAVVLLDMLTHLMPIAIEEHLDELKYLFTAYLKKAD